MVFKTRSVVLRCPADLEAYLQKVGGIDFSGVSSSTTNAGDAIRAITLEDAADWGRRRWLTELDGGERYGYETGDTVAKSNVALLASCKLLRKLTLRQTNADLTAYDRRTQHVWPKKLEDLRQNLPMDELLQLQSLRCLRFEVTESVFTRSTDVGRLAMELKTWMQGAFDGRGAHFEVTLVRRTEFGGLGF